jgi:hypothetical protein
MASLHRLQWIDAQVRARCYPNTRGLAQAFEISRRQALRDFEYLRDSLGAPLAYSARHRGYYYSTEAYTLPGPYVTADQRAVLGQLAGYYARAAAGSGAGNPIYGEMADLFLRLGGETADMTRHVTPPLLPSEWDAPQRRSAAMTTHGNVTPARFTGGWTSYISAVRGVLNAAGLSDLDYTRLMGLTGIAFHLIMHDNCHVSSATVYPWLEEHQAALDRIGVLSEVHMALPGTPTYDAACRRAVSNMKSAIDRGVGVVLWGVVTGEFGVVYGYDDAAGVLLVSGCGDVGAGSEPVPYAQVGRTFPEAPILHYQIPLERVEFDLDAAYRASLATYVEQMEREFHVAPPYKSGLRAYQAWERALAAGEYEAFGLRYLTTVYAEAKGQAAAYLEFLAASWQGLPLLPEIAARFRRLAAVYAQMMEALGQDFDSPDHLHKPVTAEQTAALLPRVAQAHAIEQEALALVKQALAGVTGA